MGGRSIGSVFTDPGAPPCYFLVEAVKDNISVPRLNATIFQSRPGDKVSVSYLSFLKFLRSFLGHLEIVTSNFSFHIILEVLFLVLSQNLGLLPLLVYRKNAEDKYI